MSINELGLNYLYLADSNILIYILWERQMNIYYHQNKGQ